MTREEAEALVDDLLDASTYYERAESGYVRSARLDYRQKKEAVIAALTTVERSESSRG